MKSIEISCYRILNYQNLTSEELIVEITKPIAFNPISVTDAFELALNAGAIQSVIWSVFNATKLNNRFEEILRTSLYEGNLKATAAMIQGGGVLGVFSQSTIDALFGVLQSRSLRMVDIVATELNETAPETITTEDIDAALGR
jgi:hypothetical protein